MSIPIIEEYVAQLCQAAGDYHQAIKEGTGDPDTVGCALFEIAQLGDMAAGGLPRFGVLATNPPGFVVTPPTSDLPYFLGVSQGEVGYSGNRITIRPSKISLARSWSYAYASSAQYGVSIGLPLTEVVRATQVYLTSLSVATAVGDHQVSVADLNLAISLGFPLQAYIGTTFVVFSGVNTAGTALLIDPGYDDGSGNYGTFQKVYSLNTRVRFDYEPRVQALYGLPVDTAYQSGNDPSAFAYFPPQPPDWLPVAQILVNNPSAPAVALNGASQPAILRTAVEWPTPDTGGAPIFDDTDAASIQQACDIATSALVELSNRAGSGDLIRALEDYTNNIAASSQTSFRAYWGARPFRANSFYARGVSFDDMERFEFPDSFASAYFDIANTDVQHTFAVFRGDRYAHPSVLSGSAPTGAAANSYQAGAGLSSLTRGTYFYGVSAVVPNGSGPALETPAALVQTSENFATPTLVANHVYGTTLGSASFYHIYRRASINGEQGDYRLTKDGEVLDIAPPSDAFSSTPTEDYTLSANTYSAFKFQASGGAQLGGVGVALKYDGAITNTTATITAYLYSDNSGAPGTIIGTGTPIGLAEIQKGYSLFISRLIDGNGIGPLLTSLSYYWIVLKFSAAPSGGNVYLHGISGNANVLAHSSNGSSWTADTGHSAWFKFFSYIDNNRAGVRLTRRGVLLTGKIALEPRRLSVYVPPIVVPATGLVPLVAGDSDSLLGDIASQSPTTKNELNVSVTARYGALGTPVTFTVTVPQGTDRDTRFLLGSSTQLFDRVDDVQISPGAALTLVGNQIIWSPYDLITVETAP